MEQRFDSVCRMAGLMMLDGDVVYSPIAHNHPIAVRCKLPRGWNYWKKFDTEMLRASERMVVLRMQGWDKSKGIAAEIKIAKKLGIPVYYI